MCEFSDVADRAPGARAWHHRAPMAVPPETRQRALALLKRYGHNTMSFQILEPGLGYWFDGDEACVAYADTGGAWVVAGAPIAPPERDADVIAGFLEHARSRGKRVRFFGLERDLSGETDLACMPVGEQPEWDPREWPAILKKKRSLREQLRRARAKGVRVRAVSVAELEGREGPLREQVDALLENWQASRAIAPMGFVVHLDPYHQPEERRFLVAEHEGAVVGILAAVPIYKRGGWFFEDVLRDPAAPNGTIELLIDHAMGLLAAEGSRYVTFGLAPLASTPFRWLRAIRDRTRWLYDFHGLYRFKAKLMPQTWRPIYLGYPERERGLRAVVDVLKAFARGSFLRFGWHTLLHRAPLVTRVLALLLIPWTILLAIVPTAAWFPSAAVQQAWNAADLALFAGLMLLSHRWRRSLAMALSIAAAADVTLGCVQLATYNAARADGPLAWLAITAALAAPLFASIFLWQARDRSDLLLDRTGVRGRKRAVP